MGHVWNYTDRSNLTYSEEHTSQWIFVHHKSHTKSKFMARLINKFWMVGFILFVTVCGWSVYEYNGFFFKFVRRYALIYVLSVWWLSLWLTINMNDTNWMTFSLWISNCGLRILFSRFLPCSVTEPLTLPILQNFSNFTSKYCGVWSANSVRLLEIGSKSLQKPTIFRYSTVIVQHNSTSDYSAETMHRLHVSRNPTIEHCILILTHCWMFPKETIDLCSPNLAIPRTQQFTVADILRKKSCGKWRCVCW
jgi:hypothetical protein